jgi:hypothetical protein
MLRDAAAQQARRDVRSPARPGQPGVVSGLNALPILI